MLYIHDDYDSEDEEEDVQDVSTYSEADEMQDVQNVIVKEEEQGLSQLHLAAEHGHTKTAERLLMSSEYVDVLNTNHYTPLHYATLNGHIDVVYLLLCKNANVNSKNVYGETSLHLASQIGHLAIAQLLLDSNADVHVTDQFMNTPTHIAAKHGHYEVVQLLMNHSVLLICYGNRPLHAAEKFGHIEVAQLILNDDENPDATNLYGDTPLHLASKNGHCEVAFVLLRNNAVANVRNASSKAPLHIAAKMGYAEIVKTIIDHEGEVNAVDRNGDTALHYASRNGYLKVTKVLLRHNAYPDAINFYGDTPLHLASKNDHFQVVGVLLRNNANANIRNAFCKTPLHFAAEMGYVEIVKTIIYHKGEVNAIARNGNTALHCAARKGHFKVVKVLLRNNADVNIRNATGKTPLHIAAKMAHAETVKAMIDHEGRANAVESNAKAALHHAARNGHFEVVEVLLRKTHDASGKKLNAADIEKTRSAVDRHRETEAKDLESGDQTRSYESYGSETSEYFPTFSESDDSWDEDEFYIQVVRRYYEPDEKDEEQRLSELHLAAQRGDTEAVRNLLMLSANIDVLDTKHNTPLHTAALNGHVDIVNLLLSTNANVNARNAFGHTSLHLAADIGHLTIAQLLFNSHADVNASCRRQTTPLHLAARRGHKQIVENLIFNGANVNACDKNKMTPLHLTCRKGHTSIVENLLNNHAIVDVMKQYEKTPFYLAAKNGHADILDVLLRRGVCDFVFKNGIKTPLHVAVKLGHTKVVEVILKHSCTISGKLTNDGHKLQENDKNVIETRDIEPIQLLKSDGRSVSAGVVWAEKGEHLEMWRNLDGHNALELAVISIQPKIVQLLLNADQCTYSEEDLRSCFDCLIIAIYNIKESKNPAKVRSYDEQYEMKCEDGKKIAKALINSCKFNANHQIWYGSSPLHKVIAELPCRNYLIQLLLEKGADFNMRNSYGETPLIIASEKGRCDAIQIFFDWEHKSGLKLELDTRDRNGETALIKAAERNHVSVVRLLLNHKASVNLYDYCGFTALHAVVYATDTNWFDLHFFCKGLRKQHFDGVNSLETSSMDMLTCGEETVDPNTVIGRIQSYLQYREEVVKLLLDADKKNVNTLDYRGNTPLDLAEKSSIRINWATLKALKKNRGAVRNSLEPEDEARIEETKVDERGRNPLHRLIISHISDYANSDRMFPRGEGEQDRKRLDFMFYGILLRPENFMESATATDDKGRTPLHYAVMLPRYISDKDRDLLRMLLEIGSNVNAVDIYGKTPLHYVETDDQYKLLVQSKANENTKDKHGHTPRELKQLRESVTINENKAKQLTIGKKALYPLSDIALVLNTVNVTELTRHRLVEKIQIYSQSPRPQESSEEAIWNIWTENEFIRLNRRLSQLKPLIYRFMERLADAIKEKDWRFECHPTLVGSADEETKAVISADFDFNFRLIKFSKICEAFPHPLGPKGYFELREKPSDDTQSRSDGKFACFFNFDHCLLTNEVNSRFKIILEEILSDPNIWFEEHLFDWNVTVKYKSKYENLAGLCKTIQLRMIQPIEDGEGGFLFVNISIDIVACVYLKGWWSEVSLPVGISPDVKANGSTFVFGQPCFDPSKPRGAHFIFCETFARISFAPLESRIIKESAPLIKAAYIVCKMILYSNSRTTYQLKNCLLFCMEALNARNGSVTRDENKITRTELAFWVERLMFCFMEFSRRGIYSCFFMHSFRQRVVHLDDDSGHNRVLENLKEDSALDFSVYSIPFRYSLAYDYYLDLCPDDTTIDIPVVQRNDRSIGRGLRNNDDSIWEPFDREEFIRTLSSRSSH